MKTLKMLLERLAEVEAEAEKLKRQIKLRERLEVARAEAKRTKREFRRLLHLVQAQCPHTSYTGYDWSEDRKGYATLRCNQCGLRWRND